MHLNLVLQGYVISTPTVISQYKQTDLDGQGQNVSH